MSRLSEKYGKKVSERERKAIQKAMDQQKANSGRYKEVPSGEYTAIVDKLEVGQSSWGAEQVNLQFKITEGEYKGSRIFYNGTFDDHFNHGINCTAILLADLLDDEDLPSIDIAVTLGKFGDDRTWVTDFLADAAEMLEGVVFKIDYTLEKKGSNSKGKPYTNQYFEILDAWDAD